MLRGGPYWEKILLFLVVLVSPFKSSLCLGSIALFMVFFPFVSLLLAGFSAAQIELERAPGRYKLVTAALTPGLAAALTLLSPNRLKHGFGGERTEDIMPRCIIPDVLEKHPCRFCMLLLN